MPQDLEKFLLNRPQKVEGNPQLPEGDPNSFGNQLERFFTSGLGLSEQKPGDLASALGSMASMLPITKGIGAVRRGLSAERAALPAARTAVAELPAMEKLAIQDRSLSSLLNRNQNGVRVKVYDKGASMGTPTLLHEELMDYDPQAIKMWHEQYFAPGSKLKLEPVDMRNSQMVKPNEGLVPELGENKIR